MTDKTKLSLPAAFNIPSSSPNELFEQLKKERAGGQGMETKDCHRTFFFVKFLLLMENIS